MGYRMTVEFEADVEVTVSCASLPEAEAKAETILKQGFFVHNRAKDPSVHLLAYYPLNQIRVIRIYEAT